MHVPSMIVGLFDPAHAYMVRNSRQPKQRRAARTRWPWHRSGGDGGYTGYALLMADGRLSQPTAEELAFLRARMQHQSENWEHEWDARLEAAEERYGDALEGVASELAARGVAAIGTPVGVVQARIIWFRRNAAVLEIDGPRAKSQARLSHAQARDASLLARYLMSFVAQLPPEA